MRNFLLQTAKPADHIHTTQQHNFPQLLKTTLPLSHLNFIFSPPPHQIASPTHQSNHPSNTLPIPPAVLLTYHPNYISNESLTQHRIKLIQIPTRDLSRPP
ncbi:arginine deiminase family protein, partial [Bacillus licheniformis]|uniref:arginine deiminase family protein n=1 Tax=Bacillus licheniformis TaxID=1402 RepID=UPI003C12FD69